jgi:hypothetical protein
MLNSRFVLKYSALTPVENSVGDQEICCTVNPHKSGVIGGEVMRISGAKLSLKKLRTQINGKFNDISSGDENK